MVYVDTYIRYKREFWDKIIWANLTTINEMITLSVITLSGI
jgi:hypothetical protein